MRKEGRKGGREEQAKKRNGRGKEGRRAQERRGERRRIRRGVIPLGCPHHILTDPMGYHSLC